MEKLNKFCKLHMKDISIHKGSKYLWKCKDCDFNITVINKKKPPHQQSCIKCGQINWIPK